MATIYCRSTDGSDSDDGSTWALAKATLAAAMTAAGEGGTVYVSSNHAESAEAAILLNSPGTKDSPQRVICVNDSAEPPTAVATGGTVQTTGATSNYISFNGFAYFYGLTFNTVYEIRSLASSAAGYIVLDTCSLIFSRDTGNQFYTGIASHMKAQRIVFVNTTLSCTGTGAINLYLHCPLYMFGGSISGTAYSFMPYSIHSGANSGGQSDVRFVGVDLSAISPYTALIGVDASKSAKYFLENCKLPSGVTFVGGTSPGPGGSIVEVVNCDSADTNYRYYKYEYSGTIQHETTIVRTGGASDGTTGVSRKLVSSTAACFHVPLTLDCNVQWNEATGSELTATVHVVTDNVTLTDAECWLEIEYLGNADYPISSFVRDRADNVLSTPANQTTSTETWTTTGLTNPIKQQLSVAFTPQGKGPIRARVMLAKASTTVYVCPKMEIT